MLPIRPGPVSSETAYAWTTKILPCPCPVPELLVWVLRGTGARLLVLDQSGSVTTIQPRMWSDGSAAACMLLSRVVACATVWQKGMVKESGDMRESIVVGTDGSETAKVQRSMAEAIRIAEALGTRIARCSAYQPLKGARIRGAGLAAGGRQLMPDSVLDATLDEARATVETTGVQVRTHVTSGRPRRRTARDRRRGARTGCHHWQRWHARRRASSPGKRAEPDLAQGALQCPDRQHRPWCAPRSGPSLTAAAPTRHRRPLGATERRPERRTRGGLAPTKRLAALLVLRPPVSTRDVPSRCPLTNSRREVPWRLLTDGALGATSCCRRRSTRTVLCTAQGR